MAEDAANAAPSFDPMLRRQFDRANLTVERERRLLHDARFAEDAGARHQAVTELWESHAKLVVAIAARYRRDGIDFADLVGAGHMGLHAAITGFDPSRVDNRLAAYAVSWIRGYVRDYIRRNASMVRLPESNAHRQLSQMSGRLIAEAQRQCARERVEPTASEIAIRIGQRIGLAPRKVERCLRVVRSSMVSLHRDEDAHESHPALEETLADENARSEDDQILTMDRAKARRRVMELTSEILGERERGVFLARCMATGEEATSLKVLAERLGVSLERVHQLEKSA